MDKLQGSAELYGVRFQTILKIVFKNFFSFFHFCIQTQWFISSPSNFSQKMNYMIQHKPKLKAYLWQDSQYQDF